MSRQSVVVVGAGPAGIRAAETLLAHGIEPVVIDEAARGGGQIYRRPPSSFTRSHRTLYGSEADKALAVHEAADALRARIDYRSDTLAWNLRDGTLHTLKGHGADEIPFRSIIIASGATDRLLPCPGWTLPGTFSLGAAQIALKAQGCAIGRTVVFMGTGPLLYLVAYQYHLAGARIAAILDTSPFGRRITAAADLLARPHPFAWGVYYTLKLAAAGIRPRTGITPLAIEGTQSVDAVRFRTRAGREEAVACDAVGLGYHLRAETQLADLAGCAFRFDPLMRQWLPKIDAHGRTSVKGVYVAGDGARLLGADAAEIGGRLAALAVVDDQRGGAGGTRADALVRQQRRHQRFQRGIAHAFPLPGAQAAQLPDETLICRCEAITVGELRRSATGLGAGELNRAKAFTRVGMGRCQGRYCGIAAAEVLAAALKVDIAAVGRLRAQAPVKPLPLASATEVRP